MSTILYSEILQKLMKSLLFTETCKKKTREGQLLHFKVEKTSFCLHFCWVSAYFLNKILLHLWVSIENSTLLPTQRFHTGKICSFYLVEAFFFQENCTLFFIKLPFFIYKLHFLSKEMCFSTTVSKLRRKTVHTEMIQLFMVFFLRGETYFEGREIVLGGEKLFWGKFLFSSP